MRVPIRIIILDGCGGLGKTTLAKAIEGEIKMCEPVSKLAFPTDAGRKILDSKIEGDMSKAYAMLKEQTEILENTIKGIMAFPESVSEPRYIIVDRSFLSTAVYQTIDAPDDDTMTSLIKVFHLIFNDMLAKLNRVYSAFFITMHYFILNAPIKDIVQSKIERAYSDEKIAKMDDVDWKNQIAAFTDKTRYIVESFEAAYDIASESQKNTPMSFISYRVFDRDMFGYGSRASLPYPMKTRGEVIEKDAKNIVGFFVLTDCMEMAACFNNAKRQGV